MQWVIVFAFSVFATAFSASVRSNEKPIVCLTQKTAVCITNIAQQITSDFSYCKVIPGASKCFKDAVKECNVDLEEYKFVQEFITVLQEVCYPGTELNAKRLRHQDCIIRTYYDTEMKACIGDMLKEVQDIPLPDTKNPAEMLEYNNKVQKVACKYVDSISDCVYAAIKSGCGIDAEHFVRTFNKPSVALNKEFCKQSGYAR